MNPMTTTIAESITRAASKQTYYTIRFLVDRERVEDAYRAYGYFRWVDDTLDAETMTGVERSAFIQRQKSLLEKCYRGEITWDVDIQEQMLIDLVQGDDEKDSELQSYLSNMMQVMDFDASRHGEFAPRDETRYLAVSAAHITHMLRDTYADLQAGYYNVPREVLETNCIGLQDVVTDAYRNWVKSRVQLAHEYFKAGKDYFARVQNPHCRLACYAYIARFEWLLDTIEREGYLLRPQYNERKSARTGLWMGWLTLSSIFHSRDASIHARDTQHVITIKG
jgi:phytoene/squalene synthetase